MNTAVPLTRIKFPLLTSLKVDNYQLFPGKVNRGLHHVFLPGVTVIAGINGLGKTTLLNIMLRCLTGSREPAKFDRYNPFGGVHEMVDKDLEYFAQRVLDEAQTATAEAEFSFGNDVIRVKRSLNDLSILGLWKNNTAVSGDQQTLQQAIINCSGAGDENDFFYIVRFFTFFLEDKVSLIWNPKGQFEIFRILFFGPERARQFADLFDQIMRLDSSIRNRRAVLNKMRKELQRVTQVAQSPGLIEKVLQEKQLEATALDGEIEELNQTLQTAVRRKGALTEKVEKLFLDIEEASREYQGSVEGFFSRAFPALPEAVHLVLNQLASGTGCLVCDNPRATYPTKYLALAAQGKCPFCGDDTPQTVRAQPLETESAALCAVEDRIGQLTRSREVLETQLKHITADLDELFRKKAAMSAQMLALRNKIEELRLQLPPSEAERDAQMDQLKELQASMEQERYERNEKTKTYGTMLTTARAIVETVKDRLTEAFTYYAGEFLAERCTLTWDPESRTIGQEGESLSFPQFTVEMTSALSQAVGSPRKDSEQVSESQKEFIDLAFRMALFDAVRLPGERAMLVIETPESSLDVMFVNQAGHLLRRFALKDVSSPNVVIATTNLNRENMLRSLLGLDANPDETAKREVHQRVINLLTEAAPNAALRRYRTDYEQAFITATTAT